MGHHDIIERTGMTPLTVPSSARELFSKNYRVLTHGTNRLLLFTGDHKIDHLNADFYGDDIPDACNSPDHLFAIASKAPIGGFAAHLGLLARHAHSDKTVPLVAKLNGVTNLSSNNPRADSLYSVADVVTFAKYSKLPIVGVGYTIYLGSKHESAMLAQAAQHVLLAHQYGLVAILWVQPFERAVSDKEHPDLLAGAAGIAASLGADFVKISAAPNENPGEQAQALRQAVGAAGNTGVLCSGGALMDATTFTTQVNAQLSIAGTRGIVVGRNVYQRPLAEAVELCTELSRLIYNK